MVTIPFWMIAGFAVVGAVLVAGLLALAALVVWIEAAGYWNRWWIARPFLWEGLRDARARATDSAQEVVPDVVPRPVHAPSPGIPERRQRVLAAGRPWSAW